MMSIAKRPSNTWRVGLAGLLCLGLGATSAMAQAQNMVGRQSQNEGLLVLPAPGPVTIDGELDDWDWSGRIWAFADIEMRSRYSVEAAAMWDEDYLYMAAKWLDPTPMYSTVDPRVDFQIGWKSDSWQMRFRTDVIGHATTWFFTPERMPVFDMHYGQSMTTPFGGTGHFTVYAADDTRLGRGIEMAYRKAVDGRGFVQEVKIPWSVLWREVPAIEPGLSFQLGNEFLWGDPTGQTWPIHRYADNLKPGVTSREFFWTGWRNWGDATLVAEGNVPVREYISGEGRIEGTVPVRADIPADAARFSVAINDGEGRRVRNLAGDLLPEAYTVDVSGGRRRVEVLWNALDDAGKLVEPGTYQVAGLSHRGLGAEYEMCFYNPGTPPWDVQDGSGAWGADHTAPNGVATGGDWTFLTWAVAEGGQGLIGIDPEGRKRWGEKRGMRAAAADDAYVYGFVAHGYVHNALCRFEAQTGAYRPFMLDGEPRPFDLPLAAILGNDDDASVRAMAVQGDALVLALTAGGVAVLDRQSAELRRRLDTPPATDIAFGPDSTFYATLDGAVFRIDLEDGTRTAVATPGVERAGALAVDHDGQIAVMDTGTDSQIKVFGLDGTLAYTAGRRGGRPIRGTFDPQAMIRVSSIAVDYQGQLWAVENWDFPRRVGVWGQDGKLVRDYIGNTRYAATGCFLHDDDETLGYVGPVEVTLDREANRWHVSRVLWVPGEGEQFEIQTGSHAHPQRFRSDAGGRMREFMFRPPYGINEPYVVYMEDDDGAWRPVAAIGIVGHVSGRVDRQSVVHEAPSGEFEGLNAFDGLFWNDLNGDGRVQRDECIIVPTQRPGAVGVRSHRELGRPPLAQGSGWGGRMGKDMRFYAQGIDEYRPVRFTEAGAPVYGPEGVRRVVNHGRGDFVPVPEENLLLNLSFVGYSGPTRGVMAIDTENDEILWTYPNRFPGVHGSHRAPMAQPGLIIGPLKITGVAYVNEHVGRVFQMRGNLGQDFLMTTDGLYVGAMFRDGRLPSEALPETEAQLRGMPMEGFSVGGEPFNGWFGRHPDGKIRTLMGISRQAAMSVEVQGLESIERVSAPAIELTQALLIQAEQDNAARAVAAAEPKSYTITRLAAAPTIDGDPGDWSAVKALTIERRGSPHRAEVKLGYDDTHLYVLFDVADQSPWSNQGRDAMRLFKTGDAVDLQLGTDPDADPDRRDPVAGDLRVVMAPFEGNPVAVLMQPVIPDGDPARRVRYTSPVGSRDFDAVGIMRDARLAVKTGTGHYRLEAALPLAALGLTPEPGMTLRGDLGIISSDAQGLENIARTYWSNPHTNLVNDEPQEAWLYPNAWSTLIFE